MLRPHQREQLIRRAFKLFHKDIASFLPHEVLQDAQRGNDHIKTVQKTEKRREQLFTYAVAMVQIAYLIFKA